MSMMSAFFSIVMALVGVLLTDLDVTAAERISVKADIANIRSGPSTTDAVIWQVEKFHPLKVIQKQGSWYLFEDYEGDRGWIHEGMVTTVRTVVVKGDKTNIRSGPGTDTEIRFTVDKGVPFKIVEEKGDWIQVVHADGDQGWIHRSLVW